MWDTAYSVVLKSRKMDIRNGVTHQVLSQPRERGLGTTLAIGSGAGDQAASPDGGGYPKKQRLWVMLEIG
jgi:hypothetical protein